MITGKENRGKGAGVLFATAAPGQLVYENLVIHNLTAANEMAGVRLRAHRSGLEI